MSLELSTSLTGHAEEQLNIDQLADLSAEWIYTLWGDAAHPLFEYLGSGECGCVSLIAHSGGHSSVGPELDSRIRADREAILPPFSDMREAWNDLNREQRIAALQRFQYWQDEYKRLTTA